MDDMDRDGNGYIGTKEFSDRLRIAQQDARSVARGGADISESSNVATAPRADSTVLLATPPKQKAAFRRSPHARPSNVRAAVAAAAALGSPPRSASPLRRLAASPSQAFVSEAMDRLCAEIPSKSAARQAFLRIDKDQSGMLDARELKLALQFLGMHLSNRQAGLVLKHLDSDGDGLVSVSEFMQLVWDGKLERLRKKFRSLCVSIGGEGVQQLFRQYDRDNDGKLSFEEFRRATRKDVGMTEASVPDAELKEVFAHLDRDSDGSISMAEFADLLATVASPSEGHARYHSTTGQVLNRILQETDQKQTAASPYSKLLSLFHRFDRDSSGGLDQEELRKALLSLDIVLDRRELRALMDDMDRDGNGYIGTKEFSDRLRIARKDARDWSEAAGDSHQQPEAPPALGPLSLHQAEQESTGSTVETAMRYAEVILAKPQAFAVSVPFDTPSPRKLRENAAASIQLQSRWSKFAHRYQATGALAQAALFWALVLASVRAQHRDDHDVAARLETALSQYEEQQNGQSWESWARLYVESMRLNTPDTTADGLAEALSSIDASNARNDARTSRSGSELEAHLRPQPEPEPEPRESEPREPGPKPEPKSKPKPKPKPKSKPKTNVPDGCVSVEVVKASCSRLAASIGLTASMAASHCIFRFAKKTLKANVGERADFNIRGHIMQAQPWEMALEVYDGDGELTGTSRVDCSQDVFSGIKSSRDREDWVERVTVCEKRCAMQQSKGWMDVVFSFRPGSYVAGAFHAAKLPAVIIHSEHGPDPPARRRKTQPREIDAEAFRRLTTVKKHGNTHSSQALRRSRNATPRSPRSPQPIRTVGAGELASQASGRRLAAQRTPPRNRATPRRSTRGKSRAGRSAVKQEHAGKTAQLSTEKAAPPRSRAESPTGEVAALAAARQAAVTPEPEAQPVPRSTTEQPAAPVQRAAEELSADVNDPIEAIAAELGGGDGVVDVGAVGAEADEDLEAMAAELQMDPVATSPSALDAAFAAEFTAAAADDDDDEYNRFLARGGTLHDV